MAIQSLADYQNAVTQELVFRKTAGNVSGTSNAPKSLMEVEGIPTANSILSTVSDISTGVVPTNQSLAGAPAIRAYSPGAIGYLGEVDIWGGMTLEGSATAGISLELIDVLWVAGPFPLTTLGTVWTITFPDLSARIPDDVGYGSVRVGMYVIDGAANSTVRVTLNYTNENGGTGNTCQVIFGINTLGFTGNIAVVTTGAGRIKSIQSMTYNSASKPGATIGIVMYRTLWDYAAASGSRKKRQGPMVTGMPRVNEDAYLALLGMFKSSSGINSTYYDPINLRLRLKVG